VDLGAPGHDARPLRGRLESLRPRFDAVRQAVITAPRDVARCEREIVAMREKVRSAHPVKAGRFDLKHSPAAWWTPSSPCSSWCCRSRAGIRS
jgi:glutamate-ammonia-ligase adenylyltransferase